MNATTFAVTVHDDLPMEEGGVVAAGLHASNEAAAPASDVKLLSCFARSSSGAIIGGAVGRTWGACCELQELWVFPAHRNQGLGSLLVRKFEERARLRGCHTFYLDTFSFMAPSFYRSLGYAVVLELKGFGPGISKFTMVHETCVGPESQ